MFKYFLLTLLLISFATAFEITDNSSVTGVNINLPEPTLVIGNLTNFTSLIDTPSSYSGEGSNCVIVNVGETALVFGSCGSGGGTNNSNTSEIWITSIGDLQDVNTTQFENVGEELHLKDTWFEELFDLLFGNKDTDALPEGLTNLYDNQSWNESRYYDNATATFLQSFTEADPFWSTNLSAFNDTWVSTFNQSYEDAFQRTINGSFIEEEVDPFWSTNLSAFNDTWVSTFNQSYEDAFQRTINGSFIEEEVDPFWSDNFTLFNDTWTSTFNQSYEDAFQRSINGSFIEEEVDPKAYNGSLRPLSNNSFAEGVISQDNLTYDNGVVTAFFSEMTYGGVKFPVLSFLAQFSIVQGVINKALNIIDPANQSAELQFASTNLSKIFTFSFNGTTGDLKLDSNSDNNFFINENTNISGELNTGVLKINDVEIDTSSPVHGVVIYYNSTAGKYLLTNSPLDGDVLTYCDKVAGGTVNWLVGGGICPF